MKQRIKTENPIVEEKTNEKPLFSAGYIIRLVCKNKKSHFLTGISIAHAVLRVSLVCMHPPGFSFTLAHSDIVFS